MDSVLLDYEQTALFSLGYLWYFVTGITEDRWMPTAGKTHKKAGCSFQDGDPEASPTLGKPIFQAKTGEEHHAQHWDPGGVSGIGHQGDCQQAVWPLSP